MKVGRIMVRVLSRSLKGLYLKSYSQLAFEETMKYAKGKEQFGQPISHLQLAMHNHDPPYFMCDYKGIRFFIIG